MERVNYQVEDRIAILTIQSPPVNALGTAVQEGLRDTAARAMHDCNVDAIVITGAGTMFVAGADIRELERMAYEGVVRPILPQLLLEIEAARKPLIAAIHGNALGGGLELALAAHYRIAETEARIPRAAANVPTPQAVSACSR